MNNEILWLVRICLDQNLFSSQQAAKVRAELGDSVELMDFAQKLIDDAIVEDLIALEAAADLAMTKAAQGPPPTILLKPTPPRFLSQTTMKTKGPPPDRFPLSPSTPSGRSTMTPSPRPSANCSNPAPATAPAIFISLPMPAHSCARTASSNS